MAQAPKIFISYSHDKVEHLDRVLAFADRLRTNGIDAEIDQYNPAPPEGWPLWCERQIETADVVLMVCTETYYRRVSGGEEQGKGLGAIWEARIIRQHLYDAGAVSNKFVPVLFSDASPEQIPMPIKGGTWYVVDTEHGYEELYRRLTRQPSLVRPDLGAIRHLPPRRRQWTEAQSEATTAPAPSSSAARSPGDGTVTAGGDRSVAIGGNMTGAVIVGDRNVTSINTASDYYQIQRLNLQRFSESAVCKTIIRQAHTEESRYRKIRANMARLLSGFFLAMAFVLWLGSLSGPLVPVCIIVAASYFLYYHLIKHFDVYPALILEKRDITSGRGIVKRKIVMEKPDTSRKVLVGSIRENLDDDIPGEIGVAADDYRRLIYFNRFYETGHINQAPLQTPLFPRAGMIVLALLLLSLIISMSRCEIYDNNMHRKSGAQRLYQVAQQMS